MLSWQATLLRTHFLVTSRQILRHLGLFFIKIFGLAAGIGCALVIILFVANELTYDRFHPGSERIFRIATRRVNNLGEYRFSTTPGPLAPAIRADWPQAEAVARIISPLENANSVLTVSGEKRFFERRAWFVDPEIINVLRVPFVAGDPATALAESHAIVISESAARKYFGEGSALGRTLQLELDYDLGSTNLEDFRVSGVVRDAPANTHWKYDLLISMATLAGKMPNLDTDWADYHAKFTYLKLAPGADRPAFEKQLAAYAARAKGNDTTTTLLEYPLQPVRSIHLAPATTLEMEPPGNRYYLFIYALVAGLVLLIGIMNYVNLSASLSTLRVREVGSAKSPEAGAATSFSSFSANPPS